MERRFVSLILGLLFSICLNAQSSAFQRVLLPALEETIAANASSSAIEWFCYDLPRHLPGDNLAGYNQVLFDGSTSLVFGNSAPITMQEALKLNKVELESSGMFELVIKNLTSQPLHFSAKKPTLLGDVSDDTKWVSKQLIDNVAVNHGSQHPQDYIWERRTRIEVYKNDGLLQTENPTNIQYANAEAAFKRIHNITTKNGLETAIQHRAYAIEEKERELQTKTLVYEYYDLLHTSNPSQEQLAQADEAYTRLNPGEHALADDNVLIHEVEYVLEKEGYLTPAKGGQVDIDQIKEKSALFMKDHSVTTQTTFANLIKQRYPVLYDNESNLNNLAYIFGYENKKTTIDAFAKELDLSLMDSRSKIRLEETVAFYSKYLHSLVSGDVKTPENFISSVRNIKKEMGLPADFTLDPATEKLFGGLSAKLMAAGLSTRQITNLEYVNGKLYLLVNIDYSSVKPFVLDGASGTVNALPSFEMSSYQGGCYINKIAGDMYVVGKRLVNVDNVYTTLEKDYSYLDYKAVIFDKDMKIEDIQSIVNTYRIKAVTSPRDAFLPDFKMTSLQYDVSVDPHFQDYPSFYSANYRDLSWVLNPKPTVPAGSGIVGKIKIMINSIRTNTETLLKSGINGIYARMRSDVTLDFASELKRELEKRNIEIRSVNATMNMLEITIEIKKTGPNGEQYCYSDSKHAPY